VRFLLDTDTCIDLLRGRPQTVRNAGGVAPDDCAVSSVTVYELLTGVGKCRSPDNELRKVMALLELLHQLPFDRTAAERTAAIRVSLEKTGAMIGPYDVMLAGQSLASNITLVTSNVTEFARVPGLGMVSWR